MAEVSLLTQPDYGTRSRKRSGESLRLHCGFAALLLAARTTQVLICFHHIRQGLKVKCVILLISPSELVRALWYLQHIVLPAQLTVITHYGLKQRPLLGYEGLGGEQLASHNTSMIILSTLIRSSHLFFFSCQLFICKIQAH